jgi:hypothetical protein
MLGPTTRAVEKRGSSTVNAAASRMTSSARARERTTQPPTASTQATGRCARRACQVGCGSATSASSVGDGTGTIPPVSGIGPPTRHVTLTPAPAG